jgi:hypothetical protein
VIVVVLFVVFMALWAASLFPAPSQPFAPYGGIFAWLSVLMLGIHLFAGHLA